MIRYFTACVIVVFAGCSSPKSDVEVTPPVPTANTQMSSSTRALLRRLSEKNQDLLKRFDGLQRGDSKKNVLKSMGREPVIAQRQLWDYHLHDWGAGGDRPILRISFTNDRVETTKRLNAPYKNPWRE